LILNEKLGEGKMRDAGKLDVRIVRKLEELEELEFDNDAIE